MADLHEKRSPREAGIRSKLGGEAPGDDIAEGTRASTPFGYSGKLEFLRRACCDGRLLQSDLAVLSVLVDHANKTSGIADYQSIARIVGESGIPRTTAIRAVQRLEEAGWIVPEKRFGAISSYALTGSTPGTGSAHGTGAIRNLQRGKTGSAHGTGPVPHTEHIQGLQEKQQLQEKKTRARKNNQTLFPESRFSEFYAAYPRREGRAAAEKTWNRLRLDSLFDRITADVQARVADGGPWRGIEKRFILLPATYLNQQRWEDEWEPQRATAGTIDRDQRSDEEIQRANEDQLARFGMGEAA